MLRSPLTTRTNTAHGPRHDLRHDPPMVEQELEQVLESEAFEREAKLLDAVATKWAELRTAIRPVPDEVVAQARMRVLLARVILRG